jgi:hypothetical protein
MFAAALNPALAINASTSDGEYFSANFAGGTPASFQVR